MAQNLEEQLINGAYKLGLSLSPEVVTQFFKFHELLIKWNKAYNLTAITDPQEIISHHFLDSLSIIPYIKGHFVLDIGSGAGFPGLPCALILKDKQFCLLDSNGKKTRFMTQVVAELNLPNVTIVQSRVEKYHPSQCFDTITARAFSSIETIISQTSHLICPQGELLVMKGIYPKEEMENIKTSSQIIRLNVPGLTAERHLVCIKR